MPAPAAARADVQGQSLRERKKRATRLAIRRAALDLIAGRGFSCVTVEDIAAAADVAPRTFFNYFPSKEAVLFGANPGREEQLLSRLVHDEPGRSALDVLCDVLADLVRGIIAELAELGEDPAHRASQVRAALADAQLRAARAAHMAQTEARVAAALAERIGADPERDPYPLVLASAAFGVLRATFSYWASSGGAVQLAELTDAAYQALAGGFAEDCTLRRIALPAARPASQAAGSRPHGKDQTR